MSGLLENFLVFMESGGIVLWLIFAATFVLWVLMLERFVFLYFSFKQKGETLAQHWGARADKNSWHSRQVRRMLAQVAATDLERGIPFIKTLIALCPMFGLLGTVSGMIHLFDVMAAVGTGNARQMASGISMATMPTMAGMVAGLSGIYLASVLEAKVKSTKQLFADHLI